ncbi:MAG: hypothetical protein ACUVXJ_09660 [Phycisphaerae bacterium]
MLASDRDGSIDKTDRGILDEGVWLGHEEQQMNVTAQERRHLDVSGSVSLFVGFGGLRF